MQRKPQNPELLAKLQAKRMALAQGRQRASVIQTKSSVSDEKMDEAMKVVEEIMPKLGVKPSKRLRQKLSLILSVAETHGLDNALQMLKIDDAQLKGVLSQVMSLGSSGTEATSEGTEGTEVTSEGTEVTSDTVESMDAKEPMDVTLPSREIVPPHLPGF